jgi:hypothetical protein
MPTIDHKQFISEESAYFMNDCIYPAIDDMREGFDVLSMGGCIDAPEWLPAGSVRNAAINPSGICIAARGFHRVFN